MWRLSLVDGRRGLPEIACWQVDLTSDAEGFGCRIHRRCDIWGSTIVGATAYITNADALIRH